MHKKLRVFIKPLRGILAFTIMLGMLSAIATIAQMTLLSGVVNAVFLSHKGLTQVLLPLALLPGVLILRASLLWGREVTTQRAAILLKASLRERVFAHLLQLGPVWSSGERTGELAAVVNEGIERLDASISRYLPQLVLSIVVPLLIIVVILLVDWFSAVLLLVTGPIIPLLMFLVGSYTEKRIQAQWAALSRMSAHFLDVMQGLTTLKLFGRSQAQQERIARVSDRFRDKTLQVLRYAFLSGAVLEFMTMMAIGVIATTLGVRLLNHGITFGSAFLVLLLTPEFYRPLQELGVQRHAAMEGEAAAKRIFEILEAPLPTRVGPVVDASIPAGSITIDITDLSYTYPGKERYALDHISLSLPANTCTALVGRSGAGKSTLVNLLMRFMDATSGTISANGVSITALSPDTWRQYVALVPQRPYLFYGTVRDNIRLARSGANDSEVMQAAVLAGVTAFIDELPHGFDTQVGEQGMRLSAGQAQRVAIARAILKNAPILILDEPTSSLDPHSEALIRQSLTTLMRDRTVLVIAHRYNTIAQADRVIVLEGGRVAGAGVPDALTRSDDVYSRLPGALSTPEVSGGSIERHSAAALPRSAYAARQQNERQL
jgi:ATP-binding cassette, subfamily C, bacterial CydD